MYFKYKKDIKSDFNTRNKFKRKDNNHEETRFSAIKN